MDAAGDVRARFRAVIGAARTGRSGDVAPRVSVLLCVKDGERYLSEALASLRAQTLQDFEIVVVDDASTDGTPAVLDAFEDERLVRVRNTENVGLTRSLVRGSAIVRAEYVARLDDDDLAEPERLERQLAHMERHPEIDLLGTWTTEIDVDGRPSSRFEPDPRAALVEWELARRNVVYPSTMMIRRCSLEAVGGFDSSFPYAQDHDLCTRLVMAGGRVELLPERLARYRRGPHQITHRRSAEQRRLGLEVRRRYASWLVGRELPEPEVEALRRLFVGERLTRPETAAALRLALAVRRRLALRHPRERAALDQALADALAELATHALYHQDRPLQALRLTLGRARLGRAGLIGGFAWRQPWRITKRSIALALRRA